VVSIYKYAEKYLRQERRTEKDSILYPCGWGAQQCIQVEHKED